MDTDTRTMTKFHGNSHKDAQCQHTVMQKITITFMSVLMLQWQEDQLSPRDHVKHRVSWNLANCHATVQKLLVRKVLNKSKLWSWRVKVGRCVINMCTQLWRIRFHCLTGVTNKPTTVELCISPVYPRLAVAKFSKVHNVEIADVTPTMPT